MSTFHADQWMDYPAILVEITLVNTAKLVFWVSSFTTASDAGGGTLGMSAGNDPAGVSVQSLLTTTPPDGFDLVVNGIYDWATGADFSGLGFGGDTSVSSVTLTEYSESSTDVTPS